MDFLSGIMSIGGGILNNLFAGSRQQDAQNFAAQQIQQQEAFQERMRSTAYQTAVTDMKAAGLNPMMAAGINTSVPAGGAASSISPAPVHDLNIPQAFQTAMQVGKYSKEMELLQNQIDNVSKDTRKKVIEGNKADAETSDTLARIPGTGAESEIKNSVKEQAKNAAITAIKERPYLESWVGSVMAPTARGMQDMYKILPQLQGLQFRGTSARQQGWIGQNEVDTLNRSRSFGN